jgi:hypothetical protein
MRQGPFRLLSALAFMLALTLLASPAFAQGGGGTTLSGSIVDSSGGVIPGADVAAKNNATATVYNTVSEANGRWTIPAVAPGTYTVTISMMGFKTVVLPDVTVVTGTPATVKAVTLEVGQLQETVTVTGATEIVQTQTAAVTSTLTTTQISRTPLTTRNTLDFVTMLPGVNATGGARYSTVMGLPGGALNITIDGLNTQDQALKSDTGSAMFTYINPRLDAVEEVTVSTANPGAESSGQGAVQIRFQTRSGTNKFQGSWYHYMRRTQWNTPYWFNINQNDPPKGADAARVDTFGGRIGGPIIKDKAFFFFNYEEFRQPMGVVRSRTVLTPASLAGCMNYVGAPTGGQYGCSSGPGIDLYKLASAQNQPWATSTPDPAIGQMLSDINATLAGQTVIAGTNSVTNTLNFSNTATQRRVYPTMRGDVNVTPNNRVGVSFYIQRFISNPDILNSRDPAFPGYTMQGNQTSWRPSLMGNWRSVLGPNLVNEVRVGYMGWKGTHFSDNITPDQFPGGMRLSLPLVSTPYTGSNWEVRSAPNLNIEDSLNWVKGKHTVTFGGSYTKVGYNDLFQYYVPNTGIGFDATNDPAAAMFNTTSFPGANSTDLTNARSLYALLTGRLTSINNSAYLDPGTGKYVYNGPWQYSVHQQEYGFFVQDSWKIKPNVTLTGGLRYELQMPFYSANHFFTQLGDYNMLFGMSGVKADGTPNYFYDGTSATTGGSPTVSLVELKPGQAPFKVDKNNFAPSVGVAWRVPVKRDTFLSKIVSADPVVRGGYSRSYVREGMTNTSNIFASNPGGSIQVYRNQSLGNLIEPGASWPLLYRETSRLNPPAFSDTPSYPLTPAFGNSINAFYPETQTPWVHSFNLSFQRSLTKDTAIDVRYVGTRARGGWVNGGRRIDELNILDNGFITEFQHAQQNYLLNMANANWDSKSTAGTYGTFAYKGLPGQYQLPIFQAFYGGTTNTADPAAYTSSNYKSTTYLGYLVPTNPNVNSMASVMFSDATMRANGIKAGLPANFFYMNPAISGGSWVTGRPEDGLSSNYDAIQIELRRRMNQGLLIQGSYQYILRQESSNFLSVRVGPEMRNLERGRTEGSPIHSFKMNWVYELPFGQGKKFASNVSRGWNRLVGGWSFDGTARIQTGPVLDFGNVRLVGFTDADLQDMFKLRFEKDATNPKITRVYMLPQDVIQNTMLAYATSYASATGYSGPAPSGKYFAPIQSNGCLQVYAGACGVNNSIVAASTPIHHYVTGPRFVRFDMSISKRLDITSRVYGELRLEALNVFDAVNFYGVTAASGTTYTGYQVTSAYRDFNNTQDPGGRLLQFSYRISF